MAIKYPLSQEESIKFAEKVLSWKRKIDSDTWRYHDLSEFSGYSTLPYQRVTYIGTISGLIVNVIKYAKGDDYKDSELLICVYNMGISTKGDDRLENNLLLASYETPEMKINKEKEHLIRSLYNSIEKNFEKMESERINEEKRKADENLQNIIKRVRDVIN